MENSLKPRRALEYKPGKGSPHPVSTKFEIIPLKRASSGLLPHIKSPNPSAENTPNRKTQFLKQGIQFSLLEPLPPISFKLQFRSTRDISPIDKKTSDEKFLSKDFNYLIS